MDRIKLSDCLKLCDAADVTKVAGCGTMFTGRLGWVGEIGGSFRLLYVVHATPIELTPRAPIQKDFCGLHKRVILQKRRRTISPTLPKLPHKVANFSNWPSSSPW